MVPWVLTKTRVESRFCRKKFKPQWCMVSAGEVLILNPVVYGFYAGEVLIRNIYVSVDPYLFQYALLQPQSVGVVKSRGVGIVEQSKVCAISLCTISLCAISLCTSFWSNRPSAPSPSNLLNLCQARLQCFLKLFQGVRIAHAPSHAARRTPHPAHRCRARKRCHTTASVLAISCSSRANCRRVASLPHLQAPAFPVGSFVFGTLGWASHSLQTVRHTRACLILVATHAMRHPHVATHVLGTTGLCRWHHGWVVATPPCPRASCSCHTQCRGPGSATSLCLEQCPQSEQRISVG